ncbi:MAG: hypothetical protein HOP08_04045 [Cyclobacteriaceae bacterium]|nr:hypothetical protein [Cyclobacteriaceae bacterium]
MRDLLLIPRLLVAAGSLMIIGLGCVHMLMTFFSSRFEPRNSSVLSEMKMTPPMLTRQTSIWKMWIGFNASHSLGAIFFGTINLLLITSYSQVYLSILFQLINLLTLFFYLFLAKKYWFRTPFRGLLFSTLCFVVAFVMFLFMVKG